VDPTPAEYDVNQAIALTALFLTGVTVGQITINQSVVYVRDATFLTLTPGTPILITGAGYAGGDLRTTVVSASGQAITLADSAKVNAPKADVGTPVNPTTVVCKVEQPDGSEATPAVANITTGLYQAVFTPTLDGDHFYRYTGSGAAVGDRWRKFIVRPERVP
jgi:hypothetical protein